MTGRMTKIRDFRRGCIDMGNGDYVNNANINAFVLVSNPCHHSPTTTAT